MKKTSAIIENGNDVAMSVGSTVNFVSIQTTPEMDSYGYVHLSNGRTIGTHMDAPTADFVDIKLQSYDNGEPSEVEMFRVTPAKKINVIGLLTWYINEKSAAVHENDEYSKDYYLSMMYAIKLLEKYVNENVDEDNYDDVVLGMNSNDIESSDDT